MPDERKRATGGSGGSVPDDVKRAWDLVLHLRMEAVRSFGEPLSGQDQELRLEGIVQAPGSFSPRGGPIVSKIRCRDGSVWVIDYDLQSSYHAFTGRSVVVSGVLCKPPLQHVLGVSGHLGVATMRLVEMTPDAWLVEVGRPQHLSGRFEDGPSDARESALTFVTEQGDTFLVANNPAGATAGCTVNALVYPVERSPWMSGSPQPCLWVIGPCSCADLGELRDRPGAGLPRGFSLDAESGQVRRLPA